MVVDIGYIQNITIVTILGNPIVFADYGYSDSEWMFLGMQMENSFILST